MRARPGLSPLVGVAVAALWFLVTLVATVPANDGSSWWYSSAARAHLAVVGGVQGAADLGQRMAGP